MLIHNQEESCIFATFNQDLGCFAIGTKTGFQVFQTQPLKKIIDRPFEGGVQIIEMLYHSNIFALVGTGKNFQYSKCQVIIWDDNEQKQISELIFKTKVYGIKMRANKIIVILENKIFQYSFPEFKLQLFVDTCNNQRGMFGINQTGDHTVMAVPLPVQGTVKVFIQEDKKYSNVIKAHQSNLGALELNYSGNKLATASEKGNVVRIFNSYSGYVIQELRRGDEYATIYSINFEPKGRLIAISSDSQKVHVFKINLFDDEVNQLQENQDEILTINNSYSVLSFLSYFNLPYFAMNKSFAYTVIPETKKIVSFGVDLNQINIVTYDGKLYNSEFDIKHGGEFKFTLCPQNFMKL